MEDSVEDHIQDEVQSEVNAAVLDEDKAVADLNLKEKVKELSETVEELGKENKKIKEEFDHQRAKLKDLFLQKEEDLKRESAERLRIQTELERLIQELGEAKSQVVVAEYTRESELEDEKRRCKEELASLQQIVQESVEEASSSRKNYEEEIKHLQRVVDKLESELSDLRGGDRESGSVLGPGVLSAVTKTLVRKVGSLAPLTDLSQSDNLEDSMRKVNRYPPNQKTMDVSMDEHTESQMDEQTNRALGGQGDSVRKSKSLRSSNFLSSFRQKLNKKAQEDAAVLRSLVIPLEEEIQALKEKLRTTDDQLRMYENRTQCCTHNGACPDSSISSTLVNASSADLNKSTNSLIDSTQSLTNSSVTEVPTAESSLNSSMSDTPVRTMQGRTITESSSADGGRVCDMCANYEAQLQRAQDKARDLEKKVRLLEKAGEQYREDFQKETDFRQKMEEKWHEQREQHKKQISEFRTQMEVAESTLQELRQSFSQTFAEVQSELAKLSKDRTEVHRELVSLQKENDLLVGKHSAHSQQLQNEMINLPNTVQELQELLLRMREDLIAAKVSVETKEENEKSLRCEVQLLCDQMKSDEILKNNTEKALKMEIETSRRQLQGFERERKLREHAEVKLNTKEAYYENLITSLKSQLGSLEEEKRKSSNELIELRNQVSSLQQELDNSEAVQKDFVRLSQSLQVQLERIRVAETEVRWQHDDDVEDCTNCRVPFSVTRRKQHCRHCGRIFCTPCLSHKVPSGPHHRPSPVCDVCHTLLVPDTAPYFSTDPPPTPD